MPIVKRIEGFHAWKKLIRNSRGMVFPWNDESSWILRSSFLEKILKFEETPFFQEGFASVFAYFRGAQDETPEGWIYLSVDEREYQKTGVHTGCWTLLALRPELTRESGESVGRSSEVVRALLRSAKVWGEMRGVTRWVGPMLWGSAWDTWGTRQGGLPVSEIEENGKSSILAIDLNEALSILSLDPVVSGRLERVRAAGHIKVRTFREQKSLPSQLWELLYREQFRAQLNLQEFQFLRREWERSFDPDLSLVLEVTGEIAGAVFVRKQSTRDRPPRLVSSLEIFVEKLRRKPVSRVSVVSWVLDDSAQAFSGQAFLLAKLCERAAQAQVRTLCFELRGQSGLVANGSGDDEKMGVGELAQLLGAKAELSHYWSF